VTPRTYLTVARDASAEIEAKRSRFIGYVARAENEDVARSHIERIRKQHWDARHCCTAFVLGPTGSVARSNDDGEPSGTAGAPMLEVLRGAGVSDVVVVVVRYFGGVLLGTGGLVRAYGDATRAGLVAAGTLERRLVDLWELTVEHSEAGRVENDLRARGVVVRHVAYAERATLILASETDLDPPAFRTGVEWVDTPA
jgi:uncharacterized YigZ family protein